MNTQSAAPGSGNPALSAMARAVDFLYKTANGVLLVFMTLMCSVMLTQVVSRYLFNTPLTWPEEVARYLFIWIVFLGAAVAFRARAHLGMDFATARLPTGIRNRVARFVEVLIFGFLVLILVITPEVISVTRLQKSPVVHLSMCWVYLAFPVASVLMLMDLIVRWFCPRHPA